MPVGERRGERRGGGTDTPISVLGGTVFTGEVIALGLTKLMEDFASATI